MTRDLPNVYTEINDLSALIESDESLTIGLTLRANRGKIGEAVRVTDSVDFLSKYTFTGKPGAKQDTTYFDILELLKVSNNIYVSRSAHNPLYGGLLIKKTTKVGKFYQAVESDPKAFLVEGNKAKLAKAGDAIYIEGVGRYTLAVNPALTTIDTEVIKKEAYIDPETGEEVPAEKEVVSTEYTKFTSVTDLDDTKLAGNVVVCVAPVKLTDMKIADEIVEIAKDENDEDYVKFAGKCELDFGTGDRVKIGDGYFTVTLAEYSAKAPAGTLVKFEEEVGELKVGKVEVYRHSIANPNLFNFNLEEDLFLVTGVDQGEYNSKLGIEILSSAETTTLPETDCFQLSVVNKTTEQTVEEYLVSMNMVKKSTDGSNMFISTIINGNSDYIQIVTPDEQYILEDEIPASTEGTKSVALGGGFDGKAIDSADDIEALNVFASKLVPVSILVNGNNETADYQSTMIAICEDRKDCFCFLRAPKGYELNSIPAQRIKGIVNYKLNTLASTSYLGAMFAPHAKIMDSYNARKVTIGMDSLACKQYLRVINTDGYPYAGAGPMKGKLDNLVLDWKVGDESIEAKAINDASINFLVYEPRQKFYYFNTQNTLQLANSAFRNIGAVLNVLNIKETLAKRLKDYIQFPITDSLQEKVIRTIEQYMDGCKSSGRVSNYHLSNNTTKNDISNNELHFLLTLAPAYYAQKIYLVVNVVNATFDFELLQSA